MMELLNKFSEIKVDNSKRLPPEDMEFCKFEEKVFNNAYNAYLTAYNSVKTAFDEQKKLVGESYGYIWEYADCGINGMKNGITKLKVKLSDFHIPLPDKYLFYTFMIITKKNCVLSCSIIRLIA